MKLYSTNNPDLRVSLREAVLQGLPPDNGLYMPEEIVPLPQEFFEQLPNLSFQDIALAVSKQLIGDAVPEAELKSMIESALTFDAPVHSLDSTLHYLELFHGPTLAFKDFGARFMARLMGYFVAQDEDPRDLHILVATSGDTGGAVASGFLAVEGIKVVILYPKGRVSFLQEKQLTALGQNITALEVEGSFDECQALVKQAFLDQELRDQIRISSANSINIARLIPQVWYYFRAWQQLQDHSKPVVFCVPSGNFGNMTGGLIAQRLGLPIEGFVAATNVNDIVPEYLREGIYTARPSVATISNAMDVGNPSNFVRMLDLHDGSWDEMKAAIHGVAFDDTQTRAGIKEVFDKYGYVIDPHGAVGYLAAKDYQSLHPDHQIVILETAHPSKFPDVVEEEIGGKVEIPERLEILRHREKVAISTQPDYAGFRKWIMEF